MLALRGICEGGKIELLDPAPRDLRSLVAVVFLDVEQEQDGRSQRSSAIGTVSSFQATG